MAAPIASLQKRLNVDFTKTDLLEQALVHRSYINEHPEYPNGHNERLEFLGDAVLEISVTRHLFHQFPDKDEGVLTNWRAALVNADRLGNVATDLGLNDFIRLSRGESQDTNSKARLSILADALEATIGAIYLDQGFDAADAFITANVLSHLDEVVNGNVILDPKSIFQEKSQEILGVTPTYRVLDEKGPDHAKVFTIGLYIGSELVAKGTGSSKQTAQVAAAEAGLTAKQWI